jgi:hypothetical protein
MGMGNYEFERILQLLPEGQEEKAMEPGAFQRARRVHSAGELLRLILLVSDRRQVLRGNRRPAEAGM